MKILLTGANGYIGRRLLPVLVREGHEVVCLVRDKTRLEVENSLKDQVSFYEADLLHEDQLRNLPKDIDLAYYLVHSMGASYGKFVEKEQQTARNFANQLATTNARQIIYLSRIANDNNLSEHLQLRKKVEDILRSTTIPVTVLRTAIIIGSGSASFEIIRDLVEKLPVMIAPIWLKTKCQPIAIHNVIEYLSAAILNVQTFNRNFDIGGPSILSYKDMLLQFAKIRGFKRYIISVPVLSPKLSSYWLYFVTSTSYPLARNLVESMRNEVIANDNTIKNIIKIRLISYKEAVTKAFDKIAQNEVVSSWKDALVSSTINPMLLEYVKIPTHGCFFDQRIKAFNKPIEQVLHNIWSIGGKRGWYYWGLLWRARGFLDKLVGGVGLRRGRRNPHFLAAGDALDFWRVLVADRIERRLLLYAEMKLPGEAWLEFKITQDEKGNNFLQQTATFRPEGLWGRLYWYTVLPFHYFIFEGMAERIIQYEHPSKERNELPLKAIENDSITQLY